ncbi:MAG: hypothetical protein QXH27_00185 [Candidatus Micrarchaeia archaeon]
MPAATLSYCAPLPGIGDTVAVAMLIVFMFVGGVYMVAPLFARPGWQAWAKEEFFQVLLTLFLLANAAFFSSLACQLSLQLAGGNPFDIADKYLTELVWTQAVPTMMELFALAYEANVIGQYAVQIGPTAWGFSYAPLAGLKGLANNINLLENILGPLLSSLLLQQVLLQFIQATMFQIVLPAGILLRGISFTRDAGAFLMAAAFGFYVVFPLTYVMNAMVADVIWSDINDPSAKLGLFGLCSVPLDPGTPANPGDVSRFGIFSYFDPRRQCKAFLTISHVIPQAVFLPALSMVITTTFIKATVKVIIHKLGR